MLNSVLNRWSVTIHLTLTALFQFDLWMKYYGVTIQMKALQHCIYSVCILWCYHSNETFLAVLSHGTIYLVCISNFESVGEIL